MYGFLLQVLMIQFLGSAEAKSQASESMKDVDVTVSIEDSTVVDVLKKVNAIITPAGAAQLLTVSGKVTSADVNEGGLPGVNVLVKGSNHGTVTDANGAYTIDVPSPESILVFSSIGYKTEEAVVGGRAVIDVVLAPDVTSLQEVVVVSYGEQIKRDVTGSVVQLDASEMEDMPVAQFAQQLQGKVAGVQINQYSGQPGGGIGFRIRGAASLFAGNQPLFVVDGMPITGSIDNINPAEIETFTVLKDASSTALYGSRAANGVILITTKHAKPGDSKVEFSGYFGIQKIPQNKVPRMMTAREFAEFQNEYYEDRVKYEGYTGTLDPVYQNPERYGKGTDWFDVITRTAPIQRYNFTISNANQKSSSTVTAGYFNQEGVVINTSTQLFSLRYNQDFKFSKDKLKIGFNIAPSYRIDHNNRMETDGLGGQALVERAFEASPLIAPVNEDGTMPLYVNSPGMVSIINPYARLVKTKDDYKTTRVLGNAYLQYDILEGLSIRGNVGVDKGAETHNQFEPSTIVSDGRANALSTSVDNYSWTAETYLRYARTFSGDHSVEATAGYSVQRYDSESNSVSGIDFPTDDVEWINAATNIDAGSSSTTHYAMLSEFARLNYNYKGKYLLSGAIRRDGSSRFGANKKYGYFPSVSAGWVISDEQFMSRFAGRVDLLKLRVSYGITGNNDIGNYTFIPNTSDYNYVLNGAITSGVSISSLGNADLAWERNKQLDIGLDVSVLDNRVSLTYDYYHRISDGLIMDRPVPQASGFTTIKSNVGVFEFWGHELSISTINLTGNLKWNSSFNMSIDRSLIKSLVSPGYIRRNNTTSSDYYRLQEGHSLGEFYGFIFEGLYKDQEDLDNSPQLQKSGVTSDVGTIKMRDVSGPDGVPDGFVTDDDRTFIGDPTPDFTFGFTNEFRYKKFDLNITLAGSVGGDILNPTKWAYLSNLDGARMLLAETKDRWRSPENPGSGIYPRTKSGTTALGRQVNTQWIENGSHLTAKNISLGYTLKFNGNPSLERLRIYASVQQAFIITGYTGMNPEISKGGMDPTDAIGVDENAYPVPRTFSLGINATFK